MTEQWFLDLDGVRSGPYQTPEVLSLIAEGEVLPHHRISRSLKDSPWVTILDWRLEQARHTPTPAPRPAPPSPEPEVSPLEFNLSEPQPEPESEPESEPAPTPPPLILQPVLEKVEEPAEPVLQRERTVKLEPPMREERPSTEAPPEASRPRRDPTAELFDIIQTSKQKREIRQQHQAQAEANRSPAPTQESGLIKVLLIGAGLALIGFSLGQLFQQSAPPMEPKVARESPAPPVASASVSPTPAESVQVLDRSTEKMTIKAVVAGTPKPASKVAPKTPQTTQAPPREEPRENERELQELKDLKKELQELKAMKDQLRDNSTVEEFDEEARSAYPLEGTPTYPEPETITPGIPGGDGSGRKYRAPPSSSPPPDSYY